MTLKKESSIISINSNITDNIIRKDIKGDSKKILNCHLTYAIIFGQRTLFSFIKLLFQQNHELYFMYSITMQFLMIVETLSSIEIDVIVAKKHVFLNFIEKYLRLK